MGESVKIKMRVPADEVKKFKEKHEMFGDEDFYQVIPTDLNGHRTMFDKGTDLKEVEQDINEFFDY